MDLKNKTSILKVTALAILTYIFIMISILIQVMVSKAMTEPNGDKIVVKDIILLHTDNIYVSPTPMRIEAETYMAGFDEQMLLDTPEEQVESIIESATKYHFSEQDIALLERVTMSESSTQSFDTQVAVAQTIINRLYSGDFGDTIYDIVHTPYQYSTADNGDPNRQVAKAVQYAIDNQPYPQNMFYFREDYYHEWAVDYKKIGVLYFSTKS